MGQSSLFSRTQIAAMRDRTASRNYSASREEFRREHEIHRASGLKQRHAEKLRRIRGLKPKAIQPATPQPPRCPVATPRGTGFGPQSPTTQTPVATPSSSAAPSSISAAPPSTSGAPRSASATPSSVSAAPSSTFAEPPSASAAPLSVSAPPSLAPATLPPGSPARNPARPPIPPHVLEGARASAPDPSKQGAYRIDRDRAREGEKVRPRRTCRIDSADHGAQRLSGQTKSTINVSIPTSSGLHLGRRRNTGLRFRIPFPSRSNLVGSSVVTRLQPASVPAIHHLAFTVFGGFCQPASI
jgi:hypothetical protein